MKTIILIISLFVCGIASAHTMPGVYHVHPDDGELPQTEGKQDFAYEEYDPLHQKVAQMEREIELIKAHLEAIREWIQIIYFKNHL